MKHGKVLLFLAAAVVAAVFLWLFLPDTVLAPKESGAAAPLPAAVAMKDTSLATESLGSSNTEEPAKEEKPPGIELLSVQTDPDAANFMARVMALSSAEVRGLVDRLRSLPGNTPEAQAIAMKLNFRLDRQDFPYLLEVIDDPALADASKGSLIHVVSQLNNPAVMAALQNLVGDQDVQDDEPLFHAAVQSLVRFGSEEALASVFHRLEKARSEDSTNALVTLLVEHRNPAAEAYLHALIRNPATPYYVGSTAIYMLANHRTEASRFLLQRLIETNSAFKPAASEAMARQNSRN